MDFTGRPMKGWRFVEPEGVDEDGQSSPSTCGEPRLHPQLSARREAAPQEEAGPALRRGIRGSCSWSC